MTARIDPVLVHKLAAARLWAASSYPYLASAVFGPPVVVSPGIGTVSVDEAWRLHVDPDVVDGWTVPELGSVLVHHAGHLLRAHAPRARAAGVDHDNARWWRAAVDAEINDDLPDLALPGEPSTPAALGRPDGALAETYYDHIHAEKADTPAGSCDCGSAADGLDREWEDGDEGGSDGVPSDDQDLIRRKTAVEVLERAREHGDVPAGLRRWAEETVRSRVDWRRTLAAEIRRGVADTAGAVDYTYTRPSRRASAVRDVVLPSLRQPVPEVAVVCDTSASMDEERLGEVLASVDGILRAVGIRAGGVRVLSVDTTVHQSRRVRSASQVELLGGGGTDMAAGIEAAARSRPRPSVVIVLTDGYTGWPDRAPRGVRVVVGLIGDRAPAPPAWARSVSIV